MKLRLLLAAGAALAIGCIWWSHPSRVIQTAEVTIKIRDPRLELYGAKMVPWTTNDALRVFSRERSFQWLETYACIGLQKCGIRAIPRSSPSVNWMGGPEYQTDTLVLFGRLPKAISPFGFDLIETNGTPGIFLHYDSSAGVPGLSYGLLKSPRVFIPNEFATMNAIPTNTHGHFWLRLHGETNVLADVRIR